MKEIKTLVIEFFKKVYQDDIEIYNEFSLQHELGLYLRAELPGYKIQFERNVSYFIDSANTVKKEIDIVIFNSDKTEKYALELKCPLNGQYPEQMYSFCKDIKFMEQIKEYGFNETYCITLVSDRNFYNGIKNNGIYKYFREDHSIYGEIAKPTGIKSNTSSIVLNKEYDFEWLPLDKTRRFYVIGL